MILVTCVLSPLLIDRYGSRLSSNEESTSGDEQEYQASGALFSRILIPVSNPKTEAFLIELASILSTKSEGLLMPLNVAQLIDGQVKGLTHQEQILEIEAPTNTEIQTIRRIDASVSNGILSTAIEYQASVIVMGWSGESSFYKTIFGRMLDEVIWNATIPVLVGRLTSSMHSKQRILLVIPTRSLQSQLVQEAIEAALLISQAIEKPLEVLISGQHPDALLRLNETKNMDFQIRQLGVDVVRDVTEIAQPSDLLILTTFGSQKRFQSSLGRIPEEIAERTPASLVIIRFLNIWSSPLTVLVE